METPLDPATQLREQERAAALPYTEYPPTPAWFPVATGLWFTALLASMLYLRDSWTYAPAIFLLVAFELGFLAWYRKKRGTMPSLRGAPREFRRACTQYLCGALVVLLVVGAAALWLPHVVALLLCFLLVTTGTAAYERVYARAAEATRSRLR